MKKLKTSDLQQVGTEKTADQVLKLIGDDPETLILAIRLLDRMAFNRRSRRRRQPIA